MASYVRAAALAALLPALLVAHTRQVTSVSRRLKEV